MTPIFDLNTLPDRRLSVRKFVSLEPSMDIGRAVLYVKSDMARQLAEVIMERDDFFMSNSMNYGGVSALEYRADCIVLTTEEYRQVRMAAFKEGAQHAQGFRRYEL